MIGAEVGAEFGQYRIEEFIGRGGMGVVYRAEHVHLGRKVALKLLAPELAENPSFRERFVRESRLAAGIDHPNVIPIYEAAEIEGHYFIAMRYVDGVDLKQVVRGEGPLSLERTVLYMQQIAGALDAAHGQGLVHRDVKPGNVLVAAGSDHCYLTDFGLTKAMSSSTGFTATGQFVGTTDYCAPEQIEGKAIDRRTDVYALACVFFECLAGHPPFRRDTDMATMWAHIQEAPPSIARERPDVPESLDQVLATAMAKRKEDRYPTCSSLAAAALAALETGTGRSFADSATRLKPGAPPPTDAYPAGAAGAATPLIVSDSFTRPEDIPAAAPPPPVQQGHGSYPPSGVPPQFPPAPGTWTPGPYDSQPTAVRRHKPVTAIALIIAALLVAGGGTAAALIVTKDKDSERQANTQPAAPDREPASEPPPETTPREPIATTPADPAPSDEGLERTPAPPEDDPPAGDASEGEAVAAAAQAHWDAIAAGEFGSAFSYFASTNPQNRANWISEHRKDGITSVVAQWEAGEVSGDTATAIPVVLETESDRGGCQSWTGSYDMVKEGGEWKIQDSHLSPSDCG